VLVDRSHRVLPHGARGPLDDAQHVATYLPVRAGTFRLQ
jgi:hypothetical protein